MNRTARFGAGVAAFAAACGMAVLIPSIASSAPIPLTSSLIAPPYVTMLSGANEVPAADADGTGAATVTVNATTGQICVDLRVANIATATMAHIHQGVAGANGPVVVPLPVLPNPTSSQCVTDTTFAPLIVANPAGFYVNVHNAEFPGGAVRGQLGPVVSTAGGTQLLNEPLRAYDSRVADGKLAAGSTRVVSVATGTDAAGKSHVAVPPGATGALLRVTITDAVGAGFLQVYSNALTTPPSTSSVNWYESGAIVGADSTVAVDATGQIKITAQVNATHVVVDVIGYVYVVQTPVPVA